MALIAYSFNIAFPNILSSIYLISFLKYNLVNKARYKDIKVRLKDGFDIFISNVFTNVYSSLTMIYLGVAKGPIETGYYSSADKLRAAAQGLLTPVAQAFFPRISKTEGVEFYSLWKKSSRILVCFSIILVLFLVIFSKQIYHFFLGEQFYSGLPVYFLLCFSIISISFGISFAQNLYLVTGQTRILRKIYAFVSILHLVHMPILVHTNGALGAATSVLITETLASLLMFYFRKKCYVWSGL